MSDIGMRDIGMTGGGLTGASDESIMTGRLPVQPRNIQNRDSRTIADHTGFGVPKFETKPGQRRTHSSVKHVCAGGRLEEFVQAAAYNTKH